MKTTMYMKLAVFTENYKHGNTKFWVHKTFMYQKKILAETLAIAPTTT
jgi:hypothetical protein